MGAMNEIMREISQLGDIRYYTPKNFSNRMISTTTVENISATLECVEEGIYKWIELPEGKFIQCDNPNCWILLVNNTYYFMD